MGSARNTEVDMHAPITQLPGVGPARAALFAHLGVNTVGDLLTLRPRRYLDFRRLTQPSQMQPGDSVAAIGTIAAVGARRTRRRGIVLCEAALQCASGQLTLVWFLPARRALRPPVEQGERLLAAGIVSQGPRGLQLVHPLLERHDLAASARLVPVYPLTEGLQQHLVRRCVVAALPALAQVNDPLPALLVEKRRLLPLAQALHALHAPQHPDDIERARVRLAYDEVLAVAVAMAWRRQAVHAQVAKPCSPDSSSLKKWLNSLPYVLTAGQSAAIADIRADMQHSRPMQRLVHGDVGSGKTTVAMYAIIKAWENGLQAVLLAPTRILAEQHYQRWCADLAACGLQVTLFLGGQGAKRRDEQLSAGKADLVIGTHAVLDLPYERLGLVVVDEQHRFGVEQRASLTKRFHAHCLYLTATPIPRSLALATWGDVDVSMIPQKPAGRRPVDTRWINTAQRPAVYDFLRRQVAEGRQGYVVYPRIDAAEDEANTDLLSAGQSYPTTAEAAFSHLRTGPLAGLRLGLLHGRMTPAQQDKLMMSFAQGQTDVLVCTTVIEVGVDVPNATVMIIEQADMYGLAQLHQLRGRVGRGAQQSYCLLVADPRTSTGKERIQALRSTDDGFALAEQDLLLRGPGEVLGLRQSGYGELQHVQFPQDLPLLRFAQEDAAEVLRQDPGLDQAEHQLLHELVRSRYPEISPVAG